MKTFVLCSFVLLAQAEAGLSDEQPIRVSAAAPELLGSHWLNTPDGKPVTLASRRGKVIVVEFWTFGCINCRHNLPAYAHWQQQFSNRDVVIVGVHTPETESERDPANVARQVKRLGISYPVLLDTDGANWNRWHQRYWPAVYLVDSLGRIRYGWEGELNYAGASGEAQMAQLIEELLMEAR